MIARFPDGRERVDCYVLLFGAARQDAAIVNNATGYLMSWLAQNRSEIKRIRVFSDGVLLSKKMATVRAITKMLSK